MLNLLKYFARKVSALSPPKVDLFVPPPPLSGQLVPTTPCPQSCFILPYKYLVFLHRLFLSRHFSQVPSQETGISAH